MKDDDTQQDTIVSENGKMTMQMTLTGPVMTNELDLSLVKDEDLVALLLLEEERKAEAAENIQNLRDQLFLRVKHGDPLDVFKHDQLGGNMGVTVTVMKKRIKPTRRLNETQIISNLPKAFRDTLTFTSTSRHLKRDEFLELVDEDTKLKKACGHLVVDVPEDFRLEVQKVSAFLKLRKINERDRRLLEEE